MAISTAIALMLRIAIGLSVIGFNLLGNGLRDAVSNGPA